MDNTISPIEHNGGRIIINPVNGNARIEGTYLLHNQTTNNNEKARRYRENIRVNETPEEAQRRREVEAVRRQNLRLAESQEQTANRRVRDTNAHHDQYIRRVEEDIQQTQDDLINLNVIKHHCGKMNNYCFYCGSKNFEIEKSSNKDFSYCCRKGKNIPPSVLPEGKEYPWINQLKDPNFRQNIRSYNSSLSFASLGASFVKFNSHGPYVFKMGGGCYHLTPHTRLTSNQNFEQYAQLYYIDSADATTLRLQHNANSNCNEDILIQMDEWIRNNNLYAQNYLLMRQLEERLKQSGIVQPQIRMELNAERHKYQQQQQIHPGRLNLPSVNEVAAIFENNDGEPPWKRDVRIYPIHPKPGVTGEQLSLLSPNLDPMTYVLLYPYGTPGWEPDWRLQSFPNIQQNQVRNNLTLLQYKVALTAIRDTTFSPIMKAGKLTQQWLVDSYLQVEAKNLQFLALNQTKIRAESYKGAMDYLENSNNNNNHNNHNLSIGKPVIIPSSFEGSPRNMRERCHDAMAIFRKFGPPDLFITMTANPKWLEITENLDPAFHEQANDVPHLIARVFHLKLKELMHDLTKKHLFGKFIAGVYTIEFQKRGLPHAHILLTLDPNDKLKTPEKIDRIISAELPTGDSEKQKILRRLVEEYMIHGPCSNEICLKNDICKKKFPKNFNAATEITSDGHPKYKRSNNGEYVIKGGQRLYNQNVVPYSPYLLLKFQCHINVECCTSIKSVKYIYKYIYKGFDCANVTITSTNPNRNIEIDPNNEILQYISGRYISPPEAMWRLYQYPMHWRSHTIERLNVHGPDEQTIYFEENNQSSLQNALQHAQEKKLNLKHGLNLIHLIIVLINIYILKFHNIILLINLKENGIKENKGKIK